VPAGCVMLRLLTVARHFLKGGLDKVEGIAMLAGKMRERRHLLSHQTCLTVN